jgi:hypothetical protein
VWDRAAALPGKIAVRASFSMLEGNYAQALPFVPPVALVTLGCCLMAVRWAIDQFNSESVLFRESGRNADEVEIDAPDQNVSIRDR